MTATLIALPLFATYGFFQLDGLLISFFYLKLEVFRVYQFLITYKAQPTLNGTDIIG